MQLKLLIILLLYWEVNKKNLYLLNTTQHWNAHYMYLNLFYSN